MKLLFLRGQVPRDRDPKEIIFNKIEECDDVWTQIAYHLSNKLGYGELLYWGGIRNHKYTKNFIERYYLNFNNIKIDYVPDVIFARGGFGEYDNILKQFPNSFKIYYGAGRRHIPKHNGIDYNLILQDSPEQVIECKSIYPKIPCTMFIKPAADNIIYPIEGVDKIFDVCFPANGSQQNIKGHNFVYSTAPKNIKILNLGNKSNLIRPENIASQRVLRKDIAKYYSKCKCGIVCCSNVDSCPRVIPEMIACNLPIIVLDTVRVWEKYTNADCGITVTKERFWDSVRYVLDNLEKFNPRKMYMEELSMFHSIERLMTLIEQVNKGYRI